MRFAVSGAFALIAAVAIAQERCDAPSPGIFCNTTEIVQFQTSDCRPFHVFVTRGSDEPYPGRLGNLTKEICSAIGGQDCGFENVEFPAKSTAWGVDEWCKSAAKGAAGGQAQIEAFNQKCPDSRLILLGFSQGASVTQDILGGGGGHIFACDQAVNPAMDASSAPGSNIVAAVTFGAVIRSRNQNFTVGKGKNFDGRRARTPEQLAALNKYSDVLRDYCHYGDPMCAVGSTPENVTAHLDYFLEYNEEVIGWVVQMAKASGKVSDGSTSSKSQPSSVLSTSVVAKPTATPSAALSGVCPVSTSATDTSVAQPAQTSNSSTGNASTGSASTLGLNSAYIFILALVSTGPLSIFFW